MFSIFLSIAFKLGFQAIRCTSAVLFLASLSLILLINFSLPLHSLSVNRKKQLVALIEDAFLWRNPSSIVQVVTALRRA